MEASQRVLRLLFPSELVQVVPKIDLHFLARFGEGFQGVQRVLMWGLEPPHLAEGPRAAHMCVTSHLALSSLRCACK